MTSNQIMLKQFIEQHHFESETQDNGVVVYIPVFRDAAFLHNEAHYCETVRDARNALGY